MPERGPETFFNRELSWLEFNGRVLEEACDPSVPLAERLKFQGIVASNLDEFFMVRVAGLKQLQSNGISETSADGLLPGEQLARISSQCHTMVDALYGNWRNDLAPQLQARAEISLVRPAALTTAQRASLETFFSRDIWPVLTPLAVDRATGAVIAEDDGE